MQQTTTRSPETDGHSSYAKGLAQLQKTWWYTGLSQIRKSNSYAQRLAETETAAHYAEMKRQGHFGENYWGEEEQEGQMGTDEEMIIDSPTTININVPPEHAGKVAQDVMNGTKTPTMQNPETKQQPTTIMQEAPKESFLKKWGPWIAAAFLGGYLVVDRIMDTSGYGLNPSEFQLVDEDGKPIPVIEAE